MRCKAVWWMASLVVVLLGASASGSRAAEPTPAELLQQKLAELDQLQTEIASLREATKTPQMIGVSVELLEVSLTKMRRLGMDFNASPGEMFVVGSLGRLSQGKGAYTHTDEAPAPMRPDGAAMAGFLQALKDNNVAKSLASPCVVACSGEPASIFVGEQIPVLPAGDGVVPVQYLEAGTRLDLTAEAIGDNQVRLHVRPRISTVGPGRAVNPDGAPIPESRVQECDVSCVATLGETVALSGLTQERVEASVRDGGKVVESVNEVALLLIVRADDATRATGQAR